MNSAAAAIAPPPERHEDPAVRAATARFGMWIFLASEALFFGGLLAAYALARWRNPAGFAAASAHTDLLLGTLNTALLLTSSAAVALANGAMSFRRPRVSAAALAVAALLGVAFLAVKGLEYRNEWREGLFPGPGHALDGRVVGGAQLFFAWYFVATGLHAVHLTIGIGYCAAFAWFARQAARATAGRRRDADGPADTADPIEHLAPKVHGLGLYWHFVDVVWIVLYPLIYLVAPRT